jgi:light-regulated signal transduction histidine kinase (bacteriophytochrome)
MGQLIDDLLTFSRLGRQALRTERVNVAATVARVIDRVRADINGRRVVFRVGDLPDCEGDPGLLAQAFENLVSNAAKYTRGRDVAEIEVGRLESEEAENEVVYFVKDNGAGFDMRYAHKLFGVFQRLHRAEEYEGTGVGLAIVQRVVARHGGRVWAEGSVGRGATFYVALKPVHVGGTA